MPRPYLHRERAIHGIDDATKFNERTVANQLHDAPVMDGDRRIKDNLVVPLERSQCADLVCPHQTRIANHIGSKDC